MLKTLLATAGLSLSMLLVPIGTNGPHSTFGGVGVAPANALELEVDVDGDDGDADDDDGDRGRISCGRGKRIVEQAGYRRVRVRSCDGRIYRYSGRRHGDTFTIGVHSRRGRIVFERESD